MADLELGRKVKHPTEENSQQQQEQLSSAGEAEVKEDVPLYKRRWLVIACSVLGGVVLALGLVILILALTIFKAKEPVITVNSVVLQDLDVSNLNVSDLASSSIALTIGVHVSVYNPNHASFRYGNSTSYMYYRSTQVGQAPIPAGRIGARATESLNTTLRLSADTGVLLNPAILSDFASGSFPITTSAQVSGRLNVLNIFKHHARSSSFCSISISVKSRSVRSISCSSHVKL